MVPHVNEAETKSRRSPDVNFIGVDNDLFKKVDT